MARIEFYVEKGKVYAGGLLFCMRLFTCHCCFCLGYNDSSALSTSYQASPGMEADQCFQLRASEKEEDPMACNAHTRASRKKSRPNQLTFEQLEHRELFSVSPADHMLALAPNPVVQVDSQPPIAHMELAPPLINQSTPLVYAGPDFTIGVTDTALLSGEAISNRTEGLTITWSVVTGPGSIAIADSSSAITTVNFSAAGIYELELTVSNDFAVASDRIRITVEPTANDEEQLTTNNLLEVYEAGSGTITSALLKTTDPDNTPSQLTYTITNGPTKGMLQRSGVTATSFTQADIDAGLITYLHNGGETISDSFSFVVDDGVGTTTNGIFQIVAIPVNDEQTITTNNSMSLQSGGTATITGALLATSDPDNSAVQLMYTITSGPANGTVLRSGVATTTFTQADINSGLITYRHSGS